MIIAATPESAGGSLGRALGLEANVRAAEVAELEAARGAQTTCFLYGAPKNHDHYGLSIFCMDKH
jgi:hypothetical protein